MFCCMTKNGQSLRNEPQQQIQNHAPDSLRNSKHKIRTHVTGRGMYRPVFCFHCLANLQVRHCFISLATPFLRLDQ